jgi:hypothetical protein
VDNGRAWNIEELRLKTKKVKELEMKNDGNEYKKEMT